MKKPITNPRKRRDSSGRLTSDAAIRREKLQQIAATGSTAGIHPASLKRFHVKGYLAQDGPRVTLTKKGAAVAAGKIGAAGRGAVDFSQANREAGKAGKQNSSRGHAARAAALRSESPRMTKKQQREADEATAKAYRPRKQTTEARTLSKIIGTYAVTVAPSDGSTLGPGHVQDFQDNGWTVASAPSAPARLGSRLPGSRREVYENPDPLGPLGEARAIVLRSPAPLDLDTLSTIRHHGYDLTPAPAKMRNTPPEPIKNPGKRRRIKNPSPGEIVFGEHASAEERKMLAKALAFMGDEKLLTEPRLLKSYKAPQAMIEIGDLVALEYDSIKWDGKSRIFRHESDVKRKFLISPDGQTIVVIPPFRITKRGIEG